MEKIYLIDYKKRLEQTLQRLNKSKISKKNKELILKYHSFDSSQGLSLPRLERKIEILRLIAEKYKIEFHKATRDEYEKMICEMNGKYKEGTIWTYKKILKVFHKWINGGEEYPACVKWFKFKESKNNKLPEEMLNQEEIKKLIHASDNKRNKALISLLWETGCRIGEIGTMQLKHVSFDDFGCQIVVNGKTGMRRIRAVNAAPYLMEWINAHPYNKEPNSFLWISTQNKYGKRIDYATITKLLRKTATQANIKKPINPHNFRHSRATFMSQHLTEAQMKEYFGWTQDSSMAARYIHLSGKQVDNAILEMHGLKPKTKQENILKREACPRCKNLNDINNEYCQQCWLPLTITAKNEIDQEQQQSQEGLVNVMKLLEAMQTNPQKVMQALKIMQKNAGNTHA